LPTIEDGSDPALETPRACVQAADAARAASLAAVEEAVTSQSFGGGPDQFSPLPQKENSSQAPKICSGWLFATLRADRETIQLKDGAAMYCKRCGMDSSTTDVCEWCKQPMIKEAPGPAAGPSAQEKPEPEAPAPAKRGRSDALRFIVCLVTGVALGVISVWIAYHFTQKMPTKVYYVSVMSVQEIHQVLKAGLLFGSLLGVLLGAVLSLTHWGPFAGLILGAPLGYVSLSEPPYVGLATGAVAGIILGLIGLWGYKRPVLV